jgi:hypothetical protein
MMRAKIRLDTMTEVADFVRQLNSDGSINKYTIENEAGNHRVNARSYLGVIYASAEFGDGMYLVNETEDGVFPAFINAYRNTGNDGNFIHY